MPREIERTVQPSLLDRLTDMEPRATADPRISYAESVRQFKAAIRRDLEWLLNTRRTPEPAPPEFEELQRSTYDYGVPDFTSLDARERNTVLRYVEEAIERFEPRLADVQVSLAEVETASAHRELRFVVEGTLRMDPTPEQVQFDTVLKLTSGQYEVSTDGSGAARHA